MGLPALVPCWLIPSTTAEGTEMGERGSRSPVSASGGRPHWHQLSGGRSAFIRVIQGLQSFGGMEVGANDQTQFEERFLREGIFESSGQKGVKSIVGCKLTACDLLQTAFQKALYLRQLSLGRKKILKSLWITHLLQTKCPIFYLHTNSIVHPRFPFDYSMNQHCLTPDP